ncbi:TRL-like family protein [Leptospira noguchii str. 1993005606]|uniref:TRL-like family protein n=1 Tax=Leptospira noguchii str. 2007001578 TaxID=1049974 RepID=A0ABN0IW96_9LEPT|nr:TRL-like family protein [Leptospira noguchii]EMM98892.1 TRL-like family protein [Leptospira noguchii str. 2007001578]EPE85969.1 TRL-like family protein [Leptospira noguchii str. 1993005606]
MKKIIILALVTLGFSVFLSNCATGPQQGILITTTTFPGEINRSNEVPAAKKAEGCAHNVLYLVTWGNAAAGQIALENKISRIATVDHSTFSVLGLVYSNYCTIVNGE